MPLKMGSLRWPTLVINAVAPLDVSHGLEWAMGTGPWGEENGSLPLQSSEALFPFDFFPALLEMCLSSSKESVSGSSVRVSRAKEGPRFPS